jgi:hypothetical protein
MTNEEAIIALRKIDAKLFCNELECPIYAENREPCKICCSSAFSVAIAALLAKSKGEEQ